MACYTTPTIVMKAFPDSQSAEAVPPELMEIAIKHACAECDAYLAGRYVLPFATTPPLLERIATEIAIFNIYTSHVFIAPPRNVETTWISRYNAAIEMLKLLQSGGLTLVGVDGTPPPTTETGGAWSTTQHYAPTFHEGDDRGFRVDPDKLEAERAKR